MFRSRRGKVFLKPMTDYQLVAYVCYATSCTSVVTGHRLPWWSTQLLACVEILELSTDSFETKI